MATRGTKGNYGCKVPPGGHRKGCGAGNKVFELRKEIRKEVEKQLDKKVDKRIAAHKKEVAEMLKKKAPPRHPKSWMNDKAKK